MTFRVGQKVVCVDDRSNLWTAPWIKRGCIYEISGFTAGTHDPLGLFPDNSSDILLVGIEKPGGFAAERFRPIVERKTDISVFTEILRKASKPARAPAVTSPQDQTNG
jgi:hypothetical protein